MIPAFVSRRQLVLFWVLFVAWIALSIWMGEPPDHCNELRFTGCI